MRGDYVHYIRWRREEWEVLERATAAWAAEHALTRARPVDFIRAAALLAAAAQVGDRPPQESAA